MKNNRMRMQIRTAITSLRMFQEGLKNAAKLDDGIIDDEEKSEIDIINRLTEEYIEKIKDVADGKADLSKKKKGIFGNKKK